MNDNACDNDTNRIVSLNNKANPDADVFAGAATSPTVATTTFNIVPDAHIPPLGGKRHTKPFYPVKMKKMVKKDTVYTTHAPKSPTVAPFDAYTLSHVWTVSNSPYSPRNHNFPTSNLKKYKKTNDDKVNF